MATLVLDTLWSEYNIEQLTDLGQSLLQIKLKSVLHDVSTHVGTWLSHLSKEYWMI